MTLQVIPVSAVPSHTLLVFLLQVGLLLLLALVLGRVAIRCGLPAVVGELVAGLVFGPSLLAHLVPGLSEWLLPQQPEQFHLLDVVGLIGALLLVGLTGCRLDFGLMRNRRNAALQVSIAGLVIPLALGIAVGFVLPESLLSEAQDRTVIALFFGVAMAVSAIPVMAKTLTDMGLLHRDIGQLTLAAGTVDDVVGWLLLSVVSAMATTGVRADGVLLSLAGVAAVVVVAVILVRPLARVALRVTNRSAHDTPTVATVVVIVVLASAGTQAMGLEAVFGALVAGITISTTGQLDHARLASLHTSVLAVFAPLFFATAGLRMDLTVLAVPTVLGVAMLVLTIAIVGKFAGAYLGARLARLGHWEGIALGAGMNARGAIEVIVAMTGLRLGVLNTATYTVVILVAIATSVMAPPVLRIAMRRVDQTAEERVRWQLYAPTPGSSADPDSPKSR
ncbi:cation:proton antiporter [Saccharopolyspora sp. NPDC000995]